VTGVLTAVANPYWAEVAHLAGDDLSAGGPTLGLTALDGIDRPGYVGWYSWTVSDPDTVEFVARHCGPRVLDPLAGTGYWAGLLAACGVDVIATDQHPPAQGGNVWHTAGTQHYPVGRAEALDSAAQHGQGRTLLLSWPPYDSPIGTRLLGTRPWQRVVWMGERWGCCGDDELFQTLERDWTTVAEHQPVQWRGLHDVVAVYELTKGR
jgi:hypothetical protein